MMKRIKKREYGRNRYHRKLEEARQLDKKARKMFFFFS